MSAARLQYGAASGGVAVFVFGIGSKERRMRNLSLSIIAISIGLLFCSASRADTISASPRSVITSLVFYSAFGNGDVTFSFPPGNSSGLAQCIGFWIRGTDPGFKTILTAVLTAYQTGATIVVDADVSQIWAGSPSPYCLVTDIRY